MGEPAVEGCGWFGFFGVVGETGWGVGCVLMALFDHGGWEVSLLLWYWLVGEVLLVLCCVMRFVSGTLQLGLRYVWGAIFCCGIGYIVFGILNYGDRDSVLLVFDCGSKSVKMVLLFH